MTSARKTNPILEAIPSISSTATRETVYATMGAAYTKFPHIGAKAADSDGMTPLMRAVDQATPNPHIIVWLHDTDEHAKLSPRPLLSKLFSNGPELPGIGKAQCKNAHTPIDYMAKDLTYKKAESREKVDSGLADEKSEVISRQVVASDLVDEKAAPNSPVKVGSSSKQDFFTDTQKQECMRVLLAQCFFTSSPELLYNTDLAPNQAWLWQLRAYNFGKLTRERRNQRGKKLCSIYDEVLINCRMNQNIPSGTNHLIYKINYILEEFVIQKELHILIKPLQEMLQIFCRYYPWRYLNKKAQDVFVTTLIKFNDENLINHALHANTNTQLGEQFPENIVRALVDKAKSLHASDEMIAFLDGIQKPSKLSVSL